MLLDLEDFIRRSLTLLPSVNQETFTTIYQELSQGSFLDNKTIVDIVRKKLTLAGVKLGQLATYEYLSKLTGEKDWNIASAKKVQFINIFQAVIINDFIKTGISQLDSLLLGGIYRKNITTVASPINSGKTLLCISLGVKALKQGMKVLHIDLQGAPRDSITRYTACFSQVEYRKIINDTFNSNEKKQVKQAQAIFENNLKIIHIKDGIEIEELIKKLYSEYENFKFDVLIVNRPVLIGVKEDVAPENKIARIYRCFTTLMHHLNIAVIVPMTSSGSAVKQMSSEVLIECSDVVEEFSAMKMSGALISLSTDSNKSSNKVKIYVSRPSVAVVDIAADFQRCNILP